MVTGNSTLADPEANTYHTKNNYCGGGGMRLTARFMCDKWGMVMRLF